MSELVRIAVQKHPRLSSFEKDSIQSALDVGKLYGYGNVIAWLATEWACNLRDVSGLPESVAIEAVSGRGPYPLPHPESRGGAG